MRAAELIGVAAAVGIGVVVACSSAAKYPACEHDDQCAVSGKHDYCLDGRCVYCRTNTDCADRERCRAGKCEVDPDAPALRLDAGSDAEEDDASEGEEAGEVDNGDESAPPTSPRHVLPQGIRRYLHP